MSVKLVAALLVASALALGAVIASACDSDEKKACETVQAISAVTAVSATDVDVDVTVTLGDGTRRPPLHTAVASVRAGVIVARAVLGAAGSVLEAIGRTALVAAGALA